MLTFRELDNLPVSIIDIMVEVERTIIDDMARRIARLGKVSGTTAYQLERLQEMGALQNMTSKELAKSLKVSGKELEKLLNAAATNTLKSDDKIYKAAGLNPTALSQNKAMQQILQAGLQLTKGEFKNLTRTTAISATRQFERALDIANMQIATGAMDYQTAIRNGVRTLTQDGLASIRYASGRVDHLDVAFRRATLTGVGQTAAKVSEQRFDEMGAEYVETTAHAGARPEHAEWQGKPFFWSEKGGTNKYGYPDFVESTKYGDGGGLCGWNCRHSFFPIFPQFGYTPGYSKGLLDEYNNSTVMYNGKEMSLYDATQQQRGIERQIRKWKRESSAMDAAGLDNSMAAGKVREWQARQRDFVGQTGLKRDYFRERAGKQK